MTRNQSLVGMSNGVSPGVESSPQVDPVTKYLRAARNGRQDEMLALLQQYAHHGVHVEVCNSSGLNALHLAAKEGHLHIAQLLMDAGIDIHAMTKKGNTALHIAALSGHLPLVKLLVSRGANVNSVTPERGFTPLYMAAQENHLAVVKYLVDQGADVNLLTDDGFSPLAVAVQQRHADIVSFLLRLDSSATGGTMNANYNPTGTMNSTLGGKDSSNYNTLNSVTSTHRRQRSTSSNRRSHLPDLHIAVKKDDSKATSLLLQQASADPNVKAPGSGFTALHLAAHYGYVSIAQILLTHGADPNVPAGKDNISALHVAAKCGQTEMTRMLLGHGAEPNAKTKDGLTALHLASRNGHEDVVDCLLLHGGGGMIEFRSKTKSGLTALHLAAQANVPEGQDCTQGHIACGRLLIFHGIHVDEISRDLLTPLHISAHCGHVAMAKYLLQHYANPDARALNGFAPLHVAVRKRRIPVIILLLEYYADVNISTESGLTPMHVAAFVGAEQAMHLLLKSGAAVNAESALGERPLHLAVRANNLKLAELLLSCGSDVDARTTDGGQTCLHLAARANSTPMCELLLKHGANPSNFASSSGGHSVLHAAARDGALECVQMLLQRGVDPNCRTLKGGELTALHLAAKYGHMEVCRLLLAHGASPDIAATSASCFTPLHLAVMNGHSDVAALLLQSGASANSIAANGLSPLHMAVSRNSVEMCQRLVDQGAFPDAQTKWGESPAHTAARLGFLEMLKFLYQYCDANLYIASPLGVTPLHMAAQEDKTVVCRFLIEECRPFKGSGINNPVEMRTKSGYTALHMAVYHNCVSTVLYLLQCGRCNPNWQTGVAGYTPLHVAAQQGNTSLAQYLLRANCQPDLRTNCGATALVIASKLRYVTLVDLLKRVTTTPVTLTPEIENEIRSFRTPESIQDATQWGENVVGGQNNIAEQEDEIDYPETEDMNCFLAPADLQFLTKDADNLPLLSAVSTRSLPRSGTQTPTQFESYASFNKYLSPNRGDYGSRPPSGTSNISGYTTTSYGDNLLLSPVNAGSLMARLSISDLAHVRTFEQQVPSDNVESMPNKLSAAGFLISFVADAKGCRMRAARGNRLCFIIPARSCEQPQRITCRHVRRHKLIAPPPLAEDQALAARVLELGPVGSKFTGGPIIVEVPYVASLSNGEREIAVFTFSPKQSGGEWTEHKQPEIQARIKMLLDSHLEDQKSPNSRRSSGTFGESSKSDDSNPDQRLERVILTEIPQYIALVSRLKKDKADITPLGGIISSSVEARVQLSFPEKAVKKDVKISLHVLRIRSDIISRLLTNPQGLVTASNMFHCSPVVTIEPRKRQFHERFTICVPSPIPGVENNSGSLPRRPSFGAQSGGIRLLRSVTGGTKRSKRSSFVSNSATNIFPGLLRKSKQTRKDSIHPAVWEDITDQTRLGELQNGCVTFSSKVSARFWLVHSPKPRSTPELLKIAHAVYNEAIKVPYMAKFIVFAKRHAENEARLRLFCVTDDKHEGVMSGSTLESQENFTQIAKSRDVEVFDGNRNYLDWDANSNLFPVQHPLNSFRSTPMVSGSKEDEGGPYGGNQEQQLSLTFWAFKENRIHFFVQVKDTMYIQNGTPSGRLQIYNSGRSHLKSLRSEADLLQLHICTLSLNLPNIYASAGLDNGSGAGKDINHLVNFASAGERRRDPTGRLCEPNLSPDSSAERALLRLTVVADSIGSDWQKLGMGLGIDPNNLNIIDLQVGNGSQSSDGENTADSQKAYRMLHHWAEYQGVNATGAALEKALNNIGRGEINPKWRKPVFRAPGGGSIDRSSKDLDSRETPEENNDSRVVRKLTRVIRVDPDGTRHEYLQEVDPRDTTGASKSTDELIERAIADSPFSSENGNAAGEKVETTVRNVVIDREVVKKTIIVDGKEQVVIEPYPPRSPSQASSHLPNQNVSPTYLNGSPVDSNVSGPGTSQIPSNQNPTNGTVYSAEDDSELQTALDNYIQSNHQP
ncbi:ankyrin-3-like isoform X5 [Symsagittifera roscoffensis]|uniref:ankyrin-3-like isoform X5 n=1 Tax=Symsagittifera roscoffensis TaxID=84072 RepID=UPI00307CB49B